MTETPPSEESEKSSEPEKILLEEGVRLSKSMLWGLQTAAYCEFGPEAWGTKSVPFYITSNPYIARQYAYVVLGYLRDCFAENAPTPIDESEPIYIVDLGAGTGRFAYLFLKTFLMIQRVLRKENLKICYIMTDIAKTNIEAWKNHPFLQVFLNEGVLDFARYYHEERVPKLNLIHSKKSLTPENVVNPMIVIGNYFFDTIPQDLFIVKEGKLHEGRIHLWMNKSNTTETLSPTDPAVIQHLNHSFEYELIHPLQDYYTEFPELNKILRLYASRFENIPFQFPVGAFQTIRFFQELSRNRLLLLAGDQGRVSDDQVKKSEFLLSKHDSFSLSVNYHAIATFFRHCGGTSILTTYPEPLFVVIAALLGGEKEHFPETLLAFRTHIDYFEPKDYYKIVHNSEKEWLEPTLESILLILKLGDWDPVNFNHFFERIRQLLPKASLDEKERLVQVIYNIWDRFYPVSSLEGAFVMNLGVLLFDLEHYQEAIAFFQRALDLNYENEQVYSNIAASYTALKDFANALEWHQKAHEAKKLRSSQEI